MTESRRLLQHFPGALAYRTQKALRRMAGSPVASGNFIFARVSPDNVGRDQPDPVAPDKWWRPDQGHRPPGEHASRSSTEPLP